MFKRKGDTVKEKRNRKSAFATAAVVFALLFGIGLMLYPTISNWYNVQMQRRAISAYSETVKENGSNKNKKLWQEARRYNAQIAQTGIDLSLGQRDDSDPAMQKYLKTLDVTGTGIMGYISVPSVHIRLPIYHGVSEGVLEIAAGHLAGSSLPVGGKNTHCVITGHTGLPSAKLFTDLDKLKKGDIFQLIVLDHTLTYEVEDIHAVLPNEVSSLQIEDGRDLVTLVTCTPYGINTHRLLVRGHRIPTPKKAKIGTASKNKNSVLRKYLLLLVLMAAAVCVFIIIKKRHKKHNRIK